MTPSNIAIVLGPNLLWSKTEGTLAEMAAATSVHVVAIIEPIIQHADWFFPDDVDFNVSGMFVAMTPEPDPGPFERRRPGSLVDGDTPRKDSPAPNKLGDPTPTPRRTATLNRKQHHHASSPAFQPPLPPPEAGGVTQTQPVAEPQTQEQTLCGSTEAGQPGLAGGGGGGGQGVAPEVQLATGQQPLPLTQHSAEENR
ncbi:unnamed protein product [Oncorhynchus mykiss]|uniref:Rho-GAP domain-containing protein n=1 Tax=Oncorhynchus mykiss TaxID=8022 RepID=A0A060Z3Q3_ONCMY|nr:unnamed protein product [Oncorhynchus mykiss]